MATFVIDFDGTIVYHDYPRIGKPKPNVFEVLKRLKDEGHYLILWTCRENESGRGKDYLDQAVEFCRQNGIEFDAVNEPFDKVEFRDSKLRRKPHGDFIIDDSSLGGIPGDWEHIYDTIQFRLGKWSRTRNDELHGNGKYEGEGQDV